MNKIKKTLIKQMKEVGVYDKSFDIAITSTAKILKELEVIQIQFEESGSQYILPFTNKNGSENIAKNPMYLCIEKLRTDAITHLRELGLTPQGLKKLNANREEKGNDALSSILSQM